MCTGFELVLPEIFGAAGAAEAGAAALGAAEFGAGAAALGGAELGLGALGYGGFAGAEALGAGLGLGEAAGATFAGGMGGFAGAGWGAAEGLGLAGAYGDLGAGPMADGGWGMSQGLTAGEGSLGGAGLDWGAGDFAASLAGFGAGAGSGGFGLKDAWGAFKEYGQPAMSVYSGITGMQRAEEMRRMAKLAALKGDPWGTSGGRGMADAQLQQLMRDPSQVAASDPAYKLRIQGAQRATAQSGQDSGAMAVAGANASTDWFNARLAQLGGLAGAGTTPGQGAGTGIQGLSAAADLQSSALGSLGYAANGAVGKGGLTPQQQQQLMALALSRGG